LRIPWPRPSPGRRALERVLVVPKRKASQDVEDPDWPGETSAASDLVVRWKPGGSVGDD